MSAGYMSAYLVSISGASPAPAVAPAPGASDRSRIGERLSARS